MNPDPYQKTLDYMYGLTARGIKLGLENTRRLLAHFGDPHLQVRTVHIGGTNGKGSTAAFLESILRAAGLRVGLYTSPHLEKFEERIRIKGVPIPREELICLAARVKRAVDELQVPVTFFEFGTVLAFLYFSEKGTDWNIIEVGLGGRLDATNLAQAEVSILTSISHDHTEYLGPDVQAIAREKAFIIKPYGTVFAHIENDAAFAVVRGVSADRSARLRRLGKDFHVQVTDFDSRGQRLRFDWDEHRLEDLHIPLIGRHQSANAALAVAAGLALASKGVPLNDRDIREGLRTVRWPGRLEVIAQNPTVVLDCAHNPDGVIKLTRSVREYFTYSRMVLVLGIMRDKPIDEMLPVFADFADRILLVKSGQERGEDPKILLRKLQKYHKNTEIIEPIPRALQKAKEDADADGLICVTGSIFTVAEARKRLIDDPIFNISCDLLGNQ